MFYCLDASLNFAFMVAPCMALTTYTRTFGRRAKDKVFVLPYSLCSRNGFFSWYIVIITIYQEFRFW